MKLIKQSIPLLILLMMSSAHSASITCNQMDVKSPSGEEKGFGYPTRFVEESNEVHFILADKPLTLPPFHEVSEGVYGTKVSNYLLIKKFLGEEVVFALKIKNTGETVLFRECN
jgi:hypothetical protein